MQLLYAMTKKSKVACVKEMFKHWLDLFKASTNISCTSLVTRIATSIEALEGQNVTYISTSSIIINEHYLMQGHHLKYNAAENLVFFFLGYTNEILLPNLELRLYKSPALTFSLVAQEEARMSSVSSMSTQSRTRNEVGSFQQPQPMPSPTVP